MQRGGGGYWIRKACAQRGEGGTGYEKLVRKGGRGVLDTKSLYAKGGGGFWIGKACAQRGGRGVLDTTSLCANLTLKASSSSL